MTVDDHLGRLDLRGDQATMTFRRRLPHPIDVVWAAITDPAQRATWFGATTIEPRAGGRITMVPDEPPVAPQVKEMTGRILTWQPPSGGRAVFEHEWRQRIVEEGVVRYELTADGPETVLVFTHHGLSTRNAQGFIPGTHAYLDRLGAYLAADEIPAWSALYDRWIPAYAGQS
jgi:uncharacterized protein YndB with AHSA1/START domain